MPGLGPGFGPGRNGKGNEGSNRTTLGQLALASVSNSEKYSTLVSAPEYEHKK